MRDIASIREGYLHIDGELARREPGARTESERLGFQLHRYVNDSAYFMLAFSQFEDAVRARAGSVVASRKTTQPWPARATWDVVDLDRLSLMDMVGLLFEKGGRAYNEIGEYYRERNRVAHGDLLRNSVNVARFIDDLVDMTTRFPA